MALIQRGSDNILKSNTLENRIFEAFYFLQSDIDIDSDISLNMSIELEEQNINIDYEIPAIHTINTDGLTSIKGVDRPGDLMFSLETNGLFKSLGLISQIVEMIMYAQNKENTQYANVNNDNQIEANYNSDEQKLSGTIILPLGFDGTSSTGILQFFAEEYLT